MVLQAFFISDISFNLIIFGMCGPPFGQQKSITVNTLTELLKNKA